MSHFIDSSIWNESEIKYFFILICLKCITLQSTIPHDFNIYTCIHVESFVSMLVFNLWHHSFRRFYSFFLKPPFRFETSEVLCNLFHTEMNFKYHDNKEPLSIKISLSVHAHRNSFYYEIRILINIFVSLSIPCLTITTLFLRYDHKFFPNHTSKTPCEETRKNVSHPLILTTLQNTPINPIDDVAVHCSNSVAASTGRDHHLNVCVAKSKFKQLSAIWNSKFDHQAHSAHSNPEPLSSVCV